MQRVKTGIPGLDELLEGGFPKGATILLTGGCGTGKTTFGVQFLYFGAKDYGENGVYISFEEEPEDIMRNMSGYEWNLKELMEQRKIGILKTELHDFSALKRFIENSVDKFGAQRMVIDSLTLLGLFMKEEYELRRGLIGLMRYLRKHEITTIVTSEVPLGSEKLSFFGIEEYAVDGVIKLYYRMVGSEFLRMIGIIKMRGTKHSTKLHPIEFTPQGMVVHAHQPVFI